MHHWSALCSYKELMFITDFISRLHQTPRARLYLNANDLRLIYPALLAFIFLSLSAEKVKLLKDSSCDICHSQVCRSFSSHFTRSQLSHSAMWNQSFPQLSFTLQLHAAQCQLNEKKAKSRVR